MTRTLLSIAGFDPSGGAGALLDVRVFGALGFHGTAVLTALTVQNTREVRKVIPLPARTVSAQYLALVRDMPIWRASRSACSARARSFRPSDASWPRTRACPGSSIRSFGSSSGARFCSESAASPTFSGPSGATPPSSRRTWRKPSVLSGSPVRTPGDMREAARILFGLMTVPCLVKGGHLRKERRSTSSSTGDARPSSATKRSPKDVHGTGCFLSSAILRPSCPGPLARKGLRTRGRHGPRRHPRCRQGRKRTLRLPVR